MQTQTASPRQLRVFLCHASEDKPTVVKLHQHLKKSNVDSWLDKEKIFGGQDWQDQIRMAVHEADVVVVCLSHKSINKVGFVQREVRLALEVAAEQPEGSIFIIPLRLEACTVPYRLSQLHRIDLFERDGFDDLIKALNERIQNIQDTHQIEIAPIKYKPPRKLAPTRLQAPMTTPIDSTPIISTPTSQGLTPQHGGSRGDRVKRLVTIAIALLALIGGIAALFWSQVIKLPYDAPSPTVTSTLTPAQSGATITFDALGSSSSVIEVYPGVGNTPQDKTYDGTYYSGEKVQIVCETKGRTVTSNPAVGEQYRQSDEWYKLQTPPGTQPEYATAVYADEHGSVPQC